MAAILLAASLLTACGGGEESAAPITFPPSNAAVDQQLADEMVLTVDDVPEGYSEAADAAPASLTSQTPPSACTTLIEAEVLGTQPVAAATGKLFERNPDTAFEVTIASTAELHESASAVQAAIAGFNSPDNDLCLRRLLESRLAAPVAAIGGSPQGLNTRLERLENLQSADTFAVRLVGTTFADRQAVNVYVDVLGLAADRAKSTVAITSVNSSPSSDLEAQLLATMRQKARAAASSASANEQASSDPSTP